jgi:hypothetical protein
MLHDGTNLSRAVVFNLGYSHPQGYEITSYIDQIETQLPSRLLSKHVKIRVYQNTVLPVVLYWCETWSLILRKEHRLRVFENRILRRIFGLKKVEVTGDFRKLNN